MTTQRDPLAALARDAKGKFALKAFPERFWAKVKRALPGECWEWTGAYMGKGYGHFFWNGRRVAAHRVAFILVKGAIPIGFQLDHLCKNKSCCNPAHLEVVTSKENTMRGNGPTSQHAKVTHCPKGHPYESNNILPSGDGHRRCRACNNIKTHSANRRLRRALHALTDEEVKP